uniref:tRNA(Met) cytidine acetate ligase n=1 Tax=Agathobacter sp. TaxID=2021311 RepID=UPI004055AED9
MKVIGITAEYNPFHNGHKYQIEELKKRTGADYVVIAMSGNFVQRGTPALCDKYSRAKMALSNGADLVLELPVIWATASAELFAKGGVTLFSHTGVVTHLGFGAETDNLGLLKQVALVLSEEPKIYKNALSAYLKKGNNFPTARKLALLELLSNDSILSMPLCPAELENLLSSPNNILGIEYLKAIYAQNKKRAMPFSFANENDFSYTLQKPVPVLIQRKGAGYHNTDISEQYPSASAIRNMLLSEYTNKTAIPHTCYVQADTNTQSSPGEKSYINSLTSSMPEEAFCILLKLLEQHALLNENDISSILAYRLLSLRKEGYAPFADCSIDFSNKIAKNLCNYTNFTEFCDLLKSKELTHTRISRTLLHILLDIKQSDYHYAADMGTIPYLRILGFRKSSAKLLSAIKKEATVPLIAKVANAASILPKNAYEIFEKDLFASDIYYQLLSRKTGRKPMNEFTHPIVIL